MLVRIVTRLGRQLTRLGRFLENSAICYLGGPEDVFLHPEAIQINEARMKHLASLELDLNGKTVLEIGAGVGLLTKFFEDRGCKVLSTDGRPDNVAAIRRQYPQRRAEVLDLERTCDLASFGAFDVVFCYGVLYHLSNPQRALAALSAVCGQMILLETCVTPGKESQPYIMEEDKRVKNQALHGQGCRPTRPWVMEQLRHYYGYAYTTKTQPRNVYFDLDWVAPLTKPLHRAVFVGAKAPIDLPTLVDALPDLQSYHAG